jgi:hypothetical protein
MPSNAAYFAKDLRKEARKFTAGAYRQFRDKLLFDGLKMIDEAWPVDTGFSRASNLPFADASGGLSISLPDPDPSQYPKGTTPSVQPGAVDLEKIDQTNLVLNGTEPFDTVGIATNCIYAPALEHGHSNQNSLMYTRAASAIDRTVASASDFTPRDLE